MGHHNQMPGHSTDVLGMGQGQGQGQGSELVAQNSRRWKQGNNVQRSRNRSSSRRDIAKGKRGTGVEAEGGRKEAGKKAGARRCDNL